jgi:ribosomal protein L37AE/L43A
MQADPMAEWQRLTEHYREMGDIELQELAAGIADLTETAQQVLRNEMKNRGLGEVRAPQQAPIKRDREAVADSEISADPIFGASYAPPVNGDEDEDSPRDYTWKTELCECDTTEQARQLQEMLRRAGIDSWVRTPGSGWRISCPRVVVAADQLDEAIQVAQQPIPQDIVEDLKAEVPEFELPRCPKCGAEDPVLEAVEPTNSWICEACGANWTDPAPESQTSDPNRARFTS